MCSVPVGDRRVSATLVGIPITSVIQKGVPVKFRSYSASRQVTESYTPDRLPWLEANQHAQALVKLIAPACDRLSVLGSIRRMCSTVGDVELLAIPIGYAEHARLLFDDRLSQSRLDDCLMSASQHFRFIKNGPRYKQFLLLDRDGFALIKVDLFIADADNWGYQQLLRTGPAEFSKLAVTPTRKAGWLREGFVAIDGYVHTVAAGRVSITDEQIFFERCLTIPYCQPQDRERVAAHALNA